MARYPITALSLSNALGDDAGAVIEALLAGRSGLSDRTAFAPRWVGACSELDPLPAALADRDTRQTRIAARAFAGIAPAVARATTRWGASRVAVIIGTSTGGIGATEAAFESLLGGTKVDFDLRRHHAMQATVEVVRQLAGARGPGWCISTACSSSAKAFGSAQRLLDADLADAVIVGGVDSLCELTLRGFAALELVAPGPCRPFAHAREGITIGEGGAFALLERRGDAAVRLCGVGESVDAYHMSSPQPDGSGAAAAMTAALQAAGLEPAQIGFVNAHGTGTAAGDAAEALALAQLFGRNTPVVATKGATGHLLGAAGATEVILCALSLERGRVPGSLGATPIDPSFAIDVVESPRAIECDHALSSSFAFGGSNAAVVVGVA
ncbi:MAG: beta-ketoacyl-ACP synthase [Nannocystaceae bacterium]|nr:beta-ketoacyl-ACP synthase [Nannocystaceae bacterium]